jgi:hypothetical protein
VVAEHLQEGVQRGRRNLARFHHRAEREEDEPLSSGTSTRI